MIRFKDKIAAAEIRLLRFCFGKTHNIFAVYREVSLFLFP